MKAHEETDAIDIAHLCMEQALAIVRLISASKDGSDIQSIRNAAHAADNLIEEARHQYSIEQEQQS